MPRKVRDGNHTIVFAFSWGMCVLGRMGTKGYSAMEAIEG